MNRLVTGALGQLGSEIRRICSEDGAQSDHYIFSDVSSVPGKETLYLDITNLEAVRIVCRSERVDVIVNCAGYTDVEKAESDIAFADLLNGKAPANLAKVAAETGATLIHISTDYVFSGQGCRPYLETDESDPAGVYAVTKLEGEIAVQRSGCRSIIIRTAWMYSPYGRNFLKTMLSLTAERPFVNVVCDQVGTPTYAADLAETIVGIISSRRLDATGIYHYTDEGVASWYDFAKAINDFAGHRCDVRPCLSSEFPSKVRRPHYSVLDKSKIRSTFGLSIPHWTESLRRCLERLDDEK